jgi:hypothetical protein
MAKSGNRFLNTFPKAVRRSDARCTFNTNSSQRDFFGRLAVTKKLREEDVMSVESTVPIASMPATMFAIRAGHVLLRDAFNGAAGCSGGSAQELGSDPNPRRQELRGV